MAPSPVRQLLVWSLPSIAVLLSYLWYRNRRIGVRSDTGGSKPIEDKSVVDGKSVAEESQNQSKDETDFQQTPTERSPVCTPVKQSFNRSLSGVETTPINIVYPPELRSSKSSPVVISDEDLDIEIEKVKSMKTGYSSPSTISANISKTPSPVKEDEITCQKIIDRRTAQQEKEAFKNLVESINFDSTPKVKANTSWIEEADLEENDQNFDNTAAKKSNATEDFKSGSCGRKGKKNKKFKKLETNFTVGGRKNMAHKDNNGVEDKMRVSKNFKSQPSTDSSKSNMARRNSGHNKNEMQRQNSVGRDSANHSPSDAMLASPSLSSISDHHSENSSDSGKGGSDLATPPASRTPNLPLNSTTIYEFIIPQDLVGKLIGRQGCFVQYIKDKTNAFILVRKHPTDVNLKVCSVEGTQAEISKALKMIRDKFPSKKYPEITLEEVHLPQVVPTVPLIPDHLYLKLVEGINNDTILSSMNSPIHLFMHQPTHPTFPNLNMLSTYMTDCYNRIESPMLPTPIPQNTICAAFSADTSSWYRAMILSSDKETDTSYVKFLDYGGYGYVENSNLRQIRQDFMMLPFQAAECILSNVKSKNEDDSWPEEAFELVSNITKGSIIYTQIADYTPEGIPLVLCYVVTGPTTVVFLNQRLVDDGFAEWVPFEDSIVPEEPAAVQELPATVAA